MFIRDPKPLRGVPRIPPCLRDGTPMESLKINTADNTSIAAPDEDARSVVSVAELVNVVEREPPKRLPSFSVASTVATSTIEPEDSPLLQRVQKLEESLKKRDANVAKHINDVVDAMIETRQGMDDFEARLDTMNTTMGTAFNEHQGLLKTLLDRCDANTQKSLDLNLRIDLVMMSLQTMGEILSKYDKDLADKIKQSSLPRVANLPPKHITPKKVATPVPTPKPLPHVPGSKLPRLVEQYAIPDKQEDPF